MRNCGPSVAQPLDCGGWTPLWFSSRAWRDACRMALPGVAQPAFPPPFIGVHMRFPNQGKAASSRRSPRPHSTHAPLGNDRLEIAAPTLHRAPHRRRMPRIPLASRRRFPADTAKTPPSQMNDILQKPDDKHVAPLNDSARDASRQSPENRPRPITPPVQNQNSIFR